MAAKPRKTSTKATTKPKATAKARASAIRAKSLSVEAQTKRLQRQLGRNPNKLEVARMKVVARLVARKTR